MRWKETSTNQFEQEPYRIPEIHHCSSKKHPNNTKKVFNITTLLSKKMENLQTTTYPKNYKRPYTNAEYIIYKKPLMKKPKNPVYFLGK